MKIWIASALLAAAGVLVNAAPPSFHDTSSPEGWTITKGQAEGGSLLQAKGGAPLDLQTTNLLAVPVDATFRFRASPGDTIEVRAIEEQQDAKPLLEFTFAQQADNRAAITVRSAGRPLATNAKSNRRWDFRNTNTGALNYGWRFPKVRTLWDERDFKEIGAANARLTPFAEKVFTLRMVLAPDTRQIWLDDRLVAEDHAANARPARWAIQLAKTARVLAAEFSAPADQGRFLPLALENYSHLQRVQEATTECAPVNLKSIPLRVPKAAAPEINLGDSLDRYRLTHGTGPDTGYVNTMSAWPGAFRIDPAALTFRVPYRNYQNVWLLAWLDDRPDAVAKGTLQFFQENAGYPARTDFSISPEAIRQGLVTKLSQQTAAGKPLYLIKVPLDTGGLYGMRDRFDQFLEFQLTKPVALTRSYPDPIFYGYFPAGFPSSIHVVGITLEEAPFGFQVEPKQAHFVFERPEKPVVTVSVTNTSARILKAEVRAETTSYDGEEKRTLKARARINPGQSVDMRLAFDLRKLGWHKLKVTVKAGGVQREATLSLVLLPPDQRTHGQAANETRFGMWSLAGHYTSLVPTLSKGVVHDDPGDARYQDAYRKLGLVNIANAHSVGRNFAQWNSGDADPESQKKAIETEVANVMKMTERQAAPLYFYGGEWGIGSEAAQYGPGPLYTGEGDRPLDPEVQKVAETQVQIFTAIGKAIRAQCPQARLMLQWGAPAGSIAHLRAGIGRDLVDGFGMDAPMFELLPEISNALGSINALWMLRAEAKRLGWPRLPIGWTEGPFFPTNPGALTERDQMDYQVRYLLLGLGYGVEAFVSGVVPQDAGNYYGAEHYGAGIIHRTPLEHPKPAVAAVATMTSMLCGADPVGGIDTGCLTTYCMEFQRAKDQAKVYAIWRVNGKVQARVKVRGSKAVVTDAMGNAAPAAIKDGAIRVPLGPSPVWLTGVEKVEGFEFDPPVYDSAPAKVTRPLAAMSADQWSYDGAEDKEYAHHHFAVRRITDPKLQVEFGQGEKEYPDAVAITLPVEPGDRPLANRYGALKPKAPIVIPGKATALGVWIKGNSSWGRVVYQLRDAQGELWTSVGTKDNWNCDDTHAWSYVNFEGWRYVRFPLPGNHPYDASRDLETTWWGSRGGDGIVDLPLTLEKIIVEARNEVPVLGEMKVVPERSYKLSRLVAEYDTEEATTPAIVKRHQIRQPVPVWSGPAENLMAQLAAAGVGTAPDIREVVEPLQWRDGRQMIIRFNQAPEFKYNLYVSRYPDGKGAELLQGNVTDNLMVTGLRPEMSLYLFLTAIGADQKESKPSQVFHLITHDNFAEK
ncbi:hypothetical protein HQ590_10845 [bacterium]|nr:hypothetical protein [bacterium]